MLPALSVQLSPPGSFSLSFNPTARPYGWACYKGIIMLEKLRKILKDDFTEYLHRYIHYDVKVSIALLFTQNDEAHAVIERHIRPTDKLIKISQHLYVVIYQYTETEEEAHAATANLMRGLGDETKSIVAYTTFHETDKNSDTVVTRLYHIFEDLFSKNKEAIGSDEEYFKELEKFTIDLENL